MACIHILLSTYNGEAFLRIQLESLLAQTHTDWCLWARDEGSTDTSVSILTKISARDSRIQLLPNTEGRLGVKAAFAHLAQIANQNDAHYFAFCDQDDLWHPNKLATLLDCIQTQEARTGATTPTLSACDLRISDTQGKLIAPSHYQLAGAIPWQRTDNNWLFAHNLIPGCSMLGNRALLQAALPQAKEAVMHDWWFAATAALLGEICWVPTPLIDYRQHAQNAVGAHSIQQRMFSTFTRPAKQWQRWQRQFALTLVQNQALLTQHAKEETMHCYQQLAQFTASPSLPGMHERLRQFEKSGVQALSFARQIQLKLLIAKGMSLDL